MKILIIHPTGNKNFHYLANSICSKNSGSLIFTGLNINNNSLFSKFFPSKIIKLFESRNFSKYTKKVFSLQPIYEIFRLIKVRSKFFKHTKLLNNYFSENNLYEIFDKKCSRKLDHLNIDAVYAYEGSALETFKVAKKNKIKCFYEIPLHYWVYKKNILNKFSKKKIVKKYKNYFKYDDSIKFNKRIDQEIKLADHIIVPSETIKKSLNYYPRKLDISVINYPFGKTVNRHKKKWFNGQNKLKVLFVGRLDPRKGLSYILESISELKKKNLLNKFDISFIGDGKLAKLIKSEFKEIHLISSLSNKKVLDKMTNSDVLLFPSLYEGYGLSAIEAMSKGLVVICNKNSGFIDVCNLKDVLLIQKLSSSEITKNLIRLSEEPKLLNKIGSNALITANKYQVYHYKRKLLKVLGDKIFE